MGWVRLEQLVNWDVGDLRHVLVGHGGGDDEGGPGRAGEATSDFWLGNSRERGRGRKVVVFADLPKLVLQHGHESLEGVELGCCGLGVPRSPGSGVPSLLHSAL